MNADHQAPKQSKYANTWTESKIEQEQKVPSKNWACWIYNTLQVAENLERNSACKGK